MMPTNKNRVCGFRPLLVTALLLPLLSACAASMNADPATQFDASSAKAIVILGTSVNERQKEARVGQSLETYWQEYSVSTNSLQPEGESFVTRVAASAFSEPAYLKPSVSVLEVDPGGYALVGAGFPHLMTLFVQSKGNLKRSESHGNLESWTHTVDPRRHIAPQAAVDPRRNVMFSVNPGQIVYIGHFAFRKTKSLDNLISIDYAQDVAAARAALKGFPGIRGEMLILNLEEPTETASR